MPRLFIGLELPRALAQDLSALRGPLAGARWLDSDDYHLTLRFIGDVDLAVADDIHSVLDGIRRPPFTVSLAELAPFGGAKPRALVVTAKPCRPLVELQGEQERLLRRTGLPADTRKFTPHVTVARLRQTSPLAVADYLSLRGGPIGRSFSVDRFALFSARDSVGGGPYVVEATYPLQAIGDR